MSEESKDILILKISSISTEQVLYFLGVRHTNSPVDIQFVQLEKFWNEFLSSSRRDRIVFTEGSVREVPLSYEDSIKQRGEVGASQWLAYKANSMCVCPEPTNEEQRKALCLFFDPQNVAYALIVQNLAAWYNYSRQSDFNEVLFKSINREIKFSSIYGFVANNSWFYNQHKKLFSEQQLSDREFLQSISDPRKNDTIVNTIVAFRTKIRNEYLLSAIKKAWELGKDIFVVYGRGHLDALEKELGKIID